MEFCKVKLSGSNTEQAKTKVLEFLASSGQYKIFTPNPEFIVLANRDCSFRETLNSGDLNLCDGFGLSLYSGCPRVPGSDFMLEVCKRAVEKNIGVYLLGSGNDEVIKKTAENLINQFPGLQISGFDKGLQINEFLKYEDAENEVLISKINSSGAQILFVAFGMYKQEQWILENLSKMPNIKIAMGVGGTFDYISGIVSRAPCFLRKIGLEWLYRLFKQPRRIGRIWKATVVFTYVVIKNKIFK